MELPFHLPEDREFDVVGFGTNAVDHLIRVRRYPELGSKIEFDSHEIAPGGEVASTLVGLQRLEFRTAYAGRFGGDSAGDIGISSLSAAGVDTSSTEVIEDAETQTAFIIIDEKSGERTIFWRRDLKLSYRLDEAPLDLCARARILHLTPHDTYAAIAMARSARDAGTIVSLDIDNVFDGVGELLKLVDICICAEELPRKLLGVDDPGVALAELQKRYGCPIAGVTLGSRGSLFRQTETLVRTDAYSVPGGCVDTTGAGDAFRTGFLFGVLSGESLEGCCSLANAAAALKCRKYGAREGLPTPSELQTMLKKV